MKSNYRIKFKRNHRRIQNAILTLTILCFGLSTLAQQGKSIRVSNDQQFIKAAENPEMSFMVFEAGYPASINMQPGTDFKAFIKENGELDILSECIYAIQESSRCFDPVPPETFVCDSARAYRFDFFGCGCCPPDDAGTWSYVSGPGNVTFSSLTEDFTEFCVDAPGSYLLRYTWPDPWNSFVETEYNFYVSPYSAEIEANDSCGLTTMVHFEYSTTFGNPNSSLEWTLNGEPYAGPALNPDGDTIDFELTVPECGEWTLEATINSGDCEPLIVSVTVNLKGNSVPVISGVGADTTTICPDLPVF